MGLLVKPMIDKYYEHCRKNNLMPTEEGYRIWYEGLNIFGRQLILSMHDIYKYGEGWAQEELRKADFDLNDKIIKMEDPQNGQIIFQQKQVVESGVRKPILVRQD